MVRRGSEKARGRRDAVWGMSEEGWSSRGRSEEERGGRMRWEQVGRGWSSLEEVGAVEIHRRMEGEG
eukprot:8984662-Pyramimonas_sp.AAC.1